MTAHEWSESDLDFELDYKDEILALICAKIAEHDRSLQVEIGASELGTPCHRKLAYKLANTPPAQERDGPETQWRQTVGTAVHTWLGEMLEDLNAKELASPMHVQSSGGPARCKAAWCEFDGRKKWTHTPRFGVEIHVPVGTIDGEVIHGHIDVHDRLKKVVTDWKIVGPKSLKDKHAHGPGRANEVQTMVYAGGLIAAGHEIVRVVLVYLPMNGELRDTVVWSKPYDPELRKRAFARARDIKADLDEFGADEVIPALGTKNDYCHRCPWFVMGEPTTATQCAGDPSISADRDDATMRELMEF